VHPAEVDHLNEVAVEVAGEEEPVAARRLLRRADHLDPFGLQVLVPLPRVADVERKMRQADAVPRDFRCRQLRLELEDLEDCPARHAHPADLAARPGAVGAAVHAKERAHPIRRRVGDADQPAAKHLRIELHETGEVGNGDADVAERARSHSSVSLM
jgi:hypothetical protein